MRRALLWALFFALLATGAGAGWWTWKKREAEKALAREAELCRSVHALIGGAPGAARFLREAAADPFLGEAALRGPPNSLYAFFRDRARAILPLLAEHPQPQVSRAPFAALAASNPGTAGFEPALRGLTAIPAEVPCGRPGLPQGDEPELRRLQAQAEEFWVERLAVAEAEKKEFARDREIFCRNETRLAKLKELVAAAEIACQRAKRGSVLAKRCAAPGGRVPPTIEAEQRDQDQQRDLNLRKLRQKWPDGVMAGLAC